jgi:hypothetical protein
MGRGRKPGKVKMEFTMPREATETKSDTEKRGPWPRYDAAVLSLKNIFFGASRGSDQLVSLQFGIFGP